ncbi:MAG: thiamine pyrophosphate-binding protein [Thiothrix sp.]|nr:MAG: thiamine pyrophosphate-binding protein [Thiothrix sp.]
MSEQTTVGDVVAAFLEQCGVGMAFGVISIHNMPILDAFGRREKIRFIMARGEAGATNMADGYARVGNRLGVCVTSTGTAAGNAAGAMVEALTAGSSILHITGQIEIPYLDKQRAYIHEAHKQLDMLKAVSKAAYRVLTPETALPILKQAVREAMTAPRGPVSIEIPIDVQQAKIDWPQDLAPLPIPAARPHPEAIQRLANDLAKAKRPLIWLGGGARHASAAVKRLAEMGFGIITSVQGRGVLPEDHPQSLGAFTTQASVEALYQTCDAMLVVGSRLRSNETLKYHVKLPKPLYQIDADPLAENRSYPAQYSICGDSAASLDTLADLLDGRMQIDSQFSADIAQARAGAEDEVRSGLGPYEPLVTSLQKVLGRDFNWVRDITLSNSIWGNRLLKIFAPYDGVHALGGGIGQGMQMGIGAALARPERKTIALIGDGGFYVNLGELATAVQEQAPLVMLVMNDRRYGVIRNIQDAVYGGRHYYTELHTPDFGELAKTMGLAFLRLEDMSQTEGVLSQAFELKGPVLVEVDMTQIGPFAKAFAGPPVRKKAE